MGVSLISAIVELIVSDMMMSDIIVSAISGLLYIRHHAELLHAD